MHGFALGKMTKVGADHTDAAALPPVGKGGSHMEGNMVGGCMPDGLCMLPLLGRSATTSPPAPVAARALCTRQLAAPACLREACCSLAGVSPATRATGLAVMHQAASKHTAASHALFAELVHSSTMGERLDRCMSSAGMGWQARWFRQQRGIVRYNCADSLDRTNVASFYGALQVRLRASCWDCAAGGCAPHVLCVHLWRGAALASSTRVVAPVPLIAAL